MIYDFIFPLILFKMLLQLPCLFLAVSELLKLDSSLLELFTDKCQLNIY